ncbi:MAG: calcineurin-like phosphoesterase C-terminal domain-containing protein [Bacteroidales bacterium]|nr:calcineurin-like phosphoesterase C-terminal domain-containing protein [Bacteroidales bacterium]
MKAILILLSVLRVAFVGDPQVDNATQFDYARRSIYRELRERKDLDLVIVLGDLVNDKTELIAPTVASLDSLPCPWLAVPGNHDRDRYPKELGRARDLSTWQREIGYIDTTFVCKGIRFILMNDVRTRRQADYEAGFSEEQKRWLTGVMASSGETEPIVFACHIPLAEMQARDTLEQLFAGKQRLLLVSGHTHQVRRDTLILGGRPVESLVTGAACGSWWRGFPDTDGVPDALMNCGSPRGYFVCDFTRSGHRLTYKAVASDAVASVGTIADGRLAVNVFGGSLDGSVRIRVQGRNVTLERVSTTAPEVLERIEYNRAMTREYRRAHREEFIPLRRLGSPHVWVVPEGTPLAPEPGTPVTVRYRDPRMAFRTRVHCR